MNGFTGQQYYRNIVCNFTAYYFTIYSFPGKTILDDYKY